MEQSTRTEFYDILASRKAEEAAWRRFQAITWLETLVGPLGISNPSEKEFISRLRNGLILCNAINRVQPGAVPKVVENCVPLQSMTRDSQPLPAYQYFENVRNFLVAVEELKLPAFEASDLERDTLEAGSVAKVVDCILALKSYYECKQTNNGNGYYKPFRSPMVMHSACKNDSQSISSDSCRRLDMTVTAEKQTSADVDVQRLEELIVKRLAEHMVDSKENIDEKLLMSFRIGNTDPVKLFSRVMSSCLENKLQSKIPELKSMFKDVLKENGNSPAHRTEAPVLEELSECEDLKCCRACSRKGACSHRYLFQMQEKELQELKALLTTTRREFEDLQSHFQRDFSELGTIVDEMSTAASGYQRVLNENRNLYNMVQDLKGNIRVYCRIRPTSNGKTTNAINFIGEDGSLVVWDPLKPQKEGKKTFQFNRVFGPSVTQDEVYKDTQPLIRSVMDGYNVCIFAYGQTGSGKTYTMVSVLTVHVHGKDVSGSTLRSCLHLVDLAGSERVDKSEVTGDRLKEAQYINKSLSCLGDVITALAQKNAYIPYRNSKLTLLLQDSLGGHAKTLMFAHVSPEGDSFCETVSTLKFAQRVSTVELGAARANKESSEVMQLREQVENLRKALASKEAQHAQHSKVKEPPSSPSEKFKAMAERTPPRIRRLSIENGSNMKFEKPKAIPERTPPRLRRLSIENGSSTKPEKMNAEDRKGLKTPSVPSRSRRLSLEGPRYGVKKDNFRTNVTEEDKKLQSFEPMAIHKFGYQDPEAVSKPYGVQSAVNGSTSVVEVYHVNAPRSPTSLSYQRRAIKAESRTQIPQLHLTTSPVKQVGSRNEVQRSMQSEAAAPLRDSQTPNFVSSANGKGSQIRKSLRTIGKLINGSEKKYTKDGLSPLDGANHNEDVKLPLTSNTRALRRRSLTGVSEPDGSRRSSLGGKPTDSGKCNQL
ncbi:hypothetical protein Tsubulata_016686 [Turnera subulata]|uniref:Kinesin motor domain-containing protein n=1 Tax=Turnera subulata TaxID=218843 RepID=A0A9Q0JNJ0_9ROSI|nr:hypothetical protein Tsubulata_016686 [Turnera subulata]